MSCAFQAEATKTKTSLRPYTHPLGTLHHGKKRGTCDDASTMTLVVHWWFFVPFGTRGRVLYSLSGNHPQCPFIQMTDTEVTFLSCYNTVGHTRVYVMSLTSPPDSRIVTPLSFTLFSQRLLEVQKFDSERYHQSSHPHWDLARTHKSRPLPPFHPHLITCSLEFARP